VQCAGADVERDEGCFVMQGPCTRGREHRPTWYELGWLSACLSHPVEVGRWPFRTACKILGPDRLTSLTIHHGRHMFISHALSGPNPTTPDRTLAEVRTAVGHASLLTTSACLHIAVNDDAPGNLFGVG
jgi:integrase